MTVDEATSLHVERDGQTSYFCSEHCREKFLSGPETSKPAAEAKAKTIESVGIKKQRKLVLLHVTSIFL